MSSAASQPQVFLQRSTFELRLILSSYIPPLACLWLMPTPSQPHDKLSILFLSFLEK
ncbi:hypothetical protein QWZ13_08585 [Reinekea marina]|uniref:hypothetical protein n=1 Tax=Reinekea marina TaxID=1310421 RepID=UPI0025B48C18|nr:hypothetical protein [Reinekea marina]MDN3648965.1 hypothetical protein [Reinekea marina]